MPEHPKSLDGDTYAKATVGAAVFFSVFYVGYLVGTHPPYDAFGDLIGRDFVNAWLGSHAVLTGAVGQLFDATSYSSLLHGIFPRLANHNWSYPPDILLFIWPLALVRYLTAYVLWCVVGFAIYLAVAGRHAARARDMAFLAVCPAVVLNLFAGQNGFFTAALLIVGLSLLDRRPLLAGVCIGLLTIKPQLGLLIPIALILARRWRVMASATATVAMLFALTSAIFGLSVWTEYFTLAVPFQRQVMDYGSELMPMMMPTAFMNLRLLGLDHEIALYAQVPFTLAAIAAVVWTFCKRRDPLLSLSVLITAGFVATPYVFNYDMVVFGWLIWKLQERMSSPGDARLALLVWTLPVTTMLFGIAHLPGSALVLPAFLARLVWMLKQEEWEAATAGMPRPVPA